MRPSGASLGAGEAKKMKDVRTDQGLLPFCGGWGGGELFKCQMMMSVESLLANHDF